MRVRSMRHIYLLFKTSLDNYRNFNENCSIILLLRRTLNITGLTLSITRANVNICKRIFQRDIHAYSVLHTRNANARRRKKHRLTSERKRHLKGVLTYLNETATFIWKRKHSSSWHGCSTRKQSLTDFR